ncbi:hypothetical protein SAMN04488556_4160 [Halostagnicola kamekurae]|uniref:PIN domain-containing protein n=1 Tax=Halostagnicola kamekurae TaxID=619731 RepID=A0A1I6UXU0_9EURY|nr:hypothetical protein SAMN04488556_4160 [Halostagnicola kamekurae]
MLILDSNAWIHAITVGGGRPDECIDAFLDGRESSVVDAYICAEVIENIENDHTTPQRKRDRALERFSGLIYQCPSIIACTQDQIDCIDRGEVRSRTHNKLIGRLADIQPKDAPVFNLAYEHRSSSPTIITDDEEFSQLTPSEYGITELSIRGLGLTWEAPTQTID